MHLTSIIRDEDTRWTQSITFDPTIYLEIDIKEGEVVFDELLGWEDGIEKGCFLEVTHFKHDGFVYRYIQETLTNRQGTFTNLRIARWLVDDIEDGYLRPEKALPVVCPDLIRDISDKIDDVVIAQETAARAARLAA